MTVVVASSMLGNILPFQSVWGEAQQQAFLLPMHPIGMRLTDWDSLMPMVTHVTGALVTQQSRYVQPHNILVSTVVAQ